MAAEWRTVRVFISSTFRDMHAERDWLIKRVFPALRERLEPHRIHLVDIDLRWGITEEQAENDRVLDLCLDQIDECRPFFVGLLGERYGWVPKSPPKGESRHGWTQCHTGKSVTELEIRWGVLLKNRMHDHGLFFFRDPSFICDVPQSMRHEVEAESPEAAEQLRKLKDEIRNANLPIPIVENYPCDYSGLRINWRLARSNLDESDRQSLERAAADGLIDNQDYAQLGEELRKVVNAYSVVYLHNLDTFGTLVLDRLWDAFQEEFELEDGNRKQLVSDPLLVELSYHEQFMESRLMVNVGRDSLQQILITFSDGDGDKPVLLTGPSGSGKSSVLARFVSSYRKSHPDTLIIPHFVGASPASTDLRRTLMRFCSVLKKEFDFEDAVPPDTNSLISMFRYYLTQVPEGRRVIFVVDALNQMDESENAMQLFWLPLRWPPHVKLITSCIDDMQREEAAINAFRHREHQRIDVQPLTDEERFKIITEVPSISAKSLAPAQIQKLLDNPATTNPLYLLVALEELRGFGSFELLDHRISTLPRNQDPVTELFIQVLLRLQEEFNKQTVCAILSLLACARRGLSDRELLDLIEAAGVAVQDSQSDLFPILRQLRPYLQHRGQLWDYYHRNLLKAAKQHFLADDRARGTTHQALAEYFESQDYFLESLEEQRVRAKQLPPTPRPINIRKVDELPFHLLEVAKLRAKENPDSPYWDNVVDLFTDLHFLEAKAEADLEGQP